MCVYICGVWVVLLVVVVYVVVGFSKRDGALESGGMGLAVLKVRGCESW